MIGRVYLQLLISVIVLSSYAQELIPQNFGVSIGTEVIKRDTSQLELSYAQMEYEDEFDVMLDGINLNMRLGRSDIHEFQFSLTVPHLAEDTLIKNLVIGRFGIKNIFFETEKCEMGVMGSYYFILRRPFDLEDLLMGIRLQAPMKFAITKNIAVNTEVSSAYKLFGLLGGGLQNRYNGGLEFSIGDRARLELGAIFLHQQFRPQLNEKEAIWMNRRYFSAAAMLQLNKAAALSINYREPFYQSDDIELPEFGRFLKMGVVINYQRKARPIKELRVKEQDFY